MYTRTLQVPIKDPGPFSMRKKEIQDCLVAMPHKKTNPQAKVSSREKKSRVHDVLRMVVLTYICVYFTMCIEYWITLVKIHSLLLIYNVSKYIFTINLFLLTH